VRRRPPRLERPRPQPSFSKFKSSSPYSETLTAVKYALIAVAVIGLGFTIYSIWKSNRLKEFS
jgi:hypothetical protein